MTYLAFGKGELQIANIIKYYFNSRKMMRVEFIQHEKKINELKR